MFVVTRTKRLRPVMRAPMLNVLRSPSPTPCTDGVRNQTGAEPSRGCLQRTSTGGMTRMTRGEGTMQIGTFLPTYWASYGTRTLPEAITATAQAADALGYASLWANDHVI